MVCAITLRLDDHPDNQEVLMEALATINARPLTNLKRNEQWLANTRLFSDANALRRFLMLHATGNDRIDVVELRSQAQREALRNWRNRQTEAG
jgi:hypothetical protein